MTALITPEGRFVTRITLERDIRLLEKDLTVGNYFERIELINHKKAQLTQLKRYE